MDVRGWANGFSAGLRATCWHKVQCVACYPIESSSSPASLEKVLPIYRYWTPYRCTERSRFDGLVVTGAKCASSVPPLRKADFANCFRSDLRRRTTRPMGLGRPKCMVCLRDDVSDRSSLYYAICIYC